MLPPPNTPARPPAKRPAGGRTQSRPRQPARDIPSERFHRRQLPEEQFHGKTDHPVERKNGRRDPHRQREQGKRRHLPGEKKHRDEIRLVDRADARRPESRQRQGPFDQKPQQEGQQHRGEKRGDRPGVKATSGRKISARTKAIRSMKGRVINLEEMLSAMSAWIGCAGRSSANERPPSRTRYSIFVHDPGIGDVVDQHHH